MSDKADTQMYVDFAHRSKSLRPPQAKAEQLEIRGGDLVLRIAISSLPLLGLVFCLVELAIWNAG
jgi:hypothetical protein